MLDKSPQTDGREMQPYGAAYSAVAVWAGAIAISCKAVFCISFMMVRIGASRNILDMRSHHVIRAQAVMLAPYADWRADGLGQHDEDHKTCNCCSAHRRITVDASQRNVRHAANGEPTRKSKHSA